MKTKYIVFDLDDTVFDTHGTFLKDLKNQFQIEAPKEERLTYENTEGLLKHLLDDADFMTRTPFMPGFEYLPEWMSHIQKLDPAVSFLFCTHRGYHPNAEENTEILFKSLDLSFDGGWYVDPAESPDKQVFLERRLGKGYTLVDDRPCYENKAPLSENVILMDRFWNREIITLPNQRVVDFPTMAVALRRRLQISM